MDEQERLRVLSSRIAVDACRTAHTELHSGGWYKGISEDHAPLLNTMLAQLKKQGFNSLDELFNASEELNIQELSFASRDAFQATFNGLNKDARGYTDYDEWGNAYEAIESTAEAKGLIDRLNRMWR